LKPELTEELLFHSAGTWGTSKYRRPNRLEIGGYILMDKLFNNRLGELHDKAGASA